MRELLNTFIVFGILCAGPVIFFSLAIRFFGMPKEHAVECIKRSVSKIAVIIGLLLVVPSLYYLVSSFMNEVIRGSMSLGDYVRHLWDFSFRETFDLYARLFSGFSGH